MASNNENGCPHCGNQLGFAFGTCVRCGFNYLEEKFNYIRVSVNDLEDHQLHLILQHAANTQKRN